MPIRNDRCDRWGASLASNRTFIREKAAPVVFGSVLLAVLMLAGYGTYQWLERQEHRLFNYPFWHDPSCYLLPLSVLQGDPIGTITRRRILVAKCSGIGTALEAHQFISSNLRTRCSVIQKV